MTLRDFCFCYVCQAWRIGIQQQWHVFLLICTCVGWRWSWLGWFVKQISQNGHTRVGAWTCLCAFSSCSCYCNKISLLYRLDKGCKNNPVIHYDFNHSFEHVENISCKLCFAGQVTFLTKLQILPVLDRGLVLLSHIQMLYLLFAWTLLGVSSWPCFKGPTCQWLTSWPSDHTWVYPRNAEMGMDTQSHISMFRDHLYFRVRV